MKTSKPGKLTVVALVAALITTTGISSAFAASSSHVWTNWYKHGLLVGGAQLMTMRTWLEKHNLADTNVELPKTFHCDPARELVRTADGSCNDLSEPAMGAAGVRFGRNMPLSAVHAPSDLEIMEPNPREISRAFLTRDQFKPVSFLNLFAATWIQFMVHDWLSHGDNEASQPFLLPLAADDPFNQPEMMILRTQHDNSHTAADGSIPISFRNEVSHWWDGSQIYGSDQATQNRLRSFKDGKIAVVESGPRAGMLPIDPVDNVEMAGFKRNWWLGIDLMHQIFVREHNAIAERLKASYPNWTDQELFDHARLVNVAVMAKIHTVEWTPAILSNPILKQGMYANWYGFNSRGGKLVDFFHALKDPVFDGIVGGKRETFDVPYSITEEFTSVYRLHSLLPEAFDVRSSETGAVIKELPLTETRDSDAHKQLDQYNITDLLYSVGAQHPGQLTLNNYPKFLQDLSIPVVGHEDLGTVDIIRDRERGVPRYNEFRRQLHLNPITKFEDLTDDPVQLEKLHRIYGDVEKLDLLIGTLAESHRPTGYGFGETQFQIFLLMASRRLEADRFFTTDFRPEVYTPEGMDWIKKASFKGVLLRHFPGLAKHLEGVDNAFRPWN
jgi:hypothetical protein